MDYSIHDAIEAGFNHVVFIIRKDIEKEFKEVIGDRIASICASHDVTVDYAFQDINDIPGTLPEGRTKPWGTGQAVLAAKDVIKTPFIVINAEYLKDVVGISGFKADQSWEYITTIRDCRNMVVHNGGRIKDDLKPKCDKFNIGYREEDSQLYIEYADVMKFYEAILDFMDRAFRLEASTSTQP